MTARSPTSLPLPLAGEGWGEASSIRKGIEAPLELLPMTVASLDAVMALETAVYPFPWSHGNFVDSIAAGHEAWLLRDRGDLVGYGVAMYGFEEMHLLNITVAPTRQRQGHGRRMLADLVARCEACGARLLWLEVRVSNVAAQQAYTRLGFTRVSMRRNYYPAARGAREDAIVMSLPVRARASTTGDSIALD